jgi:hypothetical protein
LTVPLEVERFWRNTFDRLRPDKQREEIASTERRLDPFGDFGEIRHIVGQSTNTIDFSTIMQERKILFVKLKKTLPGDAWRIIGTMLVSNLVHAVRHREQLPEAERHQFCIFVDEFQNFASSDDFAVLFTEARKYGIATTIAHQERFGQFADNKAILGATDAAGNKLFFRPAVKDADEQAPEFAKASPTETRLERQLVISQASFEDLLKGHTNPQIREFVRTYLRPLQEKLEDAKENIEGQRLQRIAWLDEVALSRVDERREGIYNTLQRSRYTPISTEALDNTERLLLRVREKTDKLISLHEYARAARLTIRGLDDAFTSMMEGRFVPRPGNEEFSDFLIQCIERFLSRKSELLALYIAIVYGDPQNPRLIPLEFATTYGLLPEAVARVRLQIEQLQGWEIEDQVQRKWQEYRTHVLEHTFRELERRKRLREEVRRATQLTPIHQHYLPVNHSQEIPVQRLLPTYMVLHANLAVQHLLATYFTTRFDPPLEPIRPIWIAGVIKEVQRFRNLNPQLLRHDERCKKCRHIHIGYSEPFLRDFQTFLEQYGEGAIVPLVLINHCANSFSGRILSSEKQITEEQAVYAGFNLLEIPRIAHREPLDVWLSLTKLAEVLDSAITRRPEYYWWTVYGATPEEAVKGYDSSWYYHAPRHIQKIMERRNLQSWGGRYTYPRTSDSLCYGALFTQVGRLFERDFVFTESRYKEKSLGSIELRTDVTRLEVLVTDLHHQMPAWWGAQEKQVLVSLIARACDLVRYGSAVADRTFPQPTIKGVPSQQVKEVVDWMTVVLQETMQRQEAQVMPNLLLAFSKEVLSYISTYLRWKEESRVKSGLQPYVVINSKRIFLPDHLPPRVLSAPEREAVRQACLTYLQANGGVKIVEDIVKFCDLIVRPENHVKVPSTQYIERQVNTYTTAEMRNQMAQELINLDPHSAYMNSTWKGKIQTLDVEAVPGAYLSAGRGDLVDVRGIAWRNALSARILRTRRDIEEEIRERQDNWRKRGGNEPPPPTSTGGNSPPSLPSASAGSNSEPPPSILKKQPEEKQPSSADVVQPRTGIPESARNKEKQEKYALIREKLLPIIQKVLVRYEENSMHAPRRPMPPLELESLRFFESAQGMLAIE